MRIGSVFGIVNVLLGAAVALAMTALSAAAFDTNARAAWVYDVATGTVLLEKNADQPIPPASMSKLMTVYMLFEALHEGRITKDTQFPVSSKAKAMQGSTMFLDERDRPTVEELIKGIIVLSGNDACVVVAEGLAGTEEAFAREATARAKALGLTETHLTNASGWPDPQHRMSTHDLGVLAQHLITDFPELYKNFAIKEYAFDNRAPANRHNRNPILGLGIGADGLKTGHTEEAGYGLVGSAVQDGRRVIFVLSGLGSEKARAEESERIVNWAFRQFTMAVDTHIFRVSNRTGIAPGKNVLEVERKLIRFVPKEYLLDAHHWLILHGRYVCKARKPQCGSCRIEDLCEYKHKTSDD